MKKTMTRQQKRDAEKLVKELKSRLPAHVRTWIEQESISSASTAFSSVKPYNAGPLGLIGAAKVWTPFTLAERLNTLSPLVA